METAIVRLVARPDRQPRSSVGRGLVVFGLGSAAQGIPLVVVASSLYERGESSTWLAAVAVARLLPYLVCSPFAGAIASAVEPRSLLAALGLVRAGFAAALGCAVAAAAPAALLVALVFFLVAAGCPAYPALMRVIHDATPAARLDRATALAAGIESAAFWAGPALGGLLLIAGGAGAVALSVAMALVTVLFARVVPLLRDRVAEDSGATGLLRAAVRVFAAPAVRLAIVSVMAINVLGGFLGVMLVRLPSDLGFGGRREFGLLSVAQGVGAVVAFAGLVGPLVLRRRPLLPLVVAAVATAALAAGTLPTSVLACAAFGAAALSSEALATNVLCRDVPAALVAPAFGLLDAAMVAAMIVGAVTAPPVVAAVGMRSAVVTVAVAVAVLGAVAARTTRAVLVARP